ncbi:hypothetical protein ACFPVT_09835 [Corynebacterium choanae]|uniref:Uncharacterized protein n=1 Tax=Corynebacterium choanae TaxID=1862358 RepID=A0A3G6J7V7_9CORY|nr:hypothetical protein [Corynebacterium choanae]AZA14201.1 hypothetical protein CCHOA_09090 [Corynebacterium choanae]
MNRFACRSAAVATAALLLVGAAPGATAATTRVSFPLTCQAQSPIAVGDLTTTIDPVYVSITAPRQLEVGKEATVTLVVHPVRIDIGKLPLRGALQEASRIKVDVRFTGARSIQASTAEPSGTITGLQAFVVDDQGNPRPTGQIVRMAGADNATIGLSPHRGSESTAGATLPLSQGTMELSFPPVNVRFTPESTAAVVIGVNTAGTAAQFAHRDNALTLLLHATAPLVGDVWVPVMCSPRRDNNAALASTATALLRIPVVDPARQTARTNTARATTPSTKTPTTASTTTRRHTAQDTTTQTGSAGSSTATTQSSKTSPADSAEIPATTDAAPRQQVKRWTLVAWLAAGVIVSGGLLVSRATRRRRK